MEKLSKETIEVALQFAKWVLNNNSIDYNPKYDDFLLTEVNDVSVISGEDLFNKFLEDGRN